MRRTRVSSSLVAAIGYDPDARVLEVEFHDTGVYRYANVPADVHRRFLRADSHGRFFNDHIRDRYAWTREG